ncbi:hypothetical protein VTO42DRAFT_41 [Malbranchea cinnamomea]
MALDSFKRDFGLDTASSTERDTLQGNIVSTFQAGTFFGALLTFPLAEKFGRKRSILGAVIVFFLGAILMVCELERCLIPALQGLLTITKTAANGRLGMIYAGRAIAGLGIGSVSLLVPVYIAETSPPSIRGRLVGVFEILSQGGGMLGFWINYIVE